MREQRVITHNCQSCGGSRNQGDYCSYCGALYLDTIASGAPAKIQCSLGEKYKIRRNNSGLEIYWRWRNRGTMFLIPFTIFWNVIAFSVSSFFINLNSLRELPSNFFSNPMQYLPLLHVFVGIGLIVCTLVSLINSTSIFASRQALRIKHYPVPWPSAKTFAADEIEQIFVSKGQRSSENNSWNVPILQLVTLNGRRHELLTGNTEVEFSDYEAIRLKLLDALGINLTHAHGSVAH